MNRGYETVKNYFEAGFAQATLVSDCWAAQLKTPTLRHQLCLAHLQRELLSFIDAFKEDKWSSELKALFDQSIAIKRQSIANGLSIHHYQKSTKHLSGSEPFG